MAPAGAAEKGRRGGEADWVDDEVELEAELELSRLKAVDGLSRIEIIGIQTKLKTFAFKWLVHELQWSKPVHWTLWRVG